MTKDWWVWLIVAIIPLYIAIDIWPDFKTGFVVPMRSRFNQEASLLIIAAGLAGAAFDTNSLLVGLAALMALATATATTLRFRAPFWAVSVGLFSVAAGHMWLNVFSTAMMALGLYVAGFAVSALECGCRAISNEEHDHYQGAY